MHKIDCCLRRWGWGVGGEERRRWWRKRNGGVAKKGVVWNEEGNDSNHLIEYKVFELERQHARRTRQDFLGKKRERERDSAWTHTQRCKVIDSLLCWIPKFQHAQLPIPPIFFFPFSSRLRVSSSKTNWISAVFYLIYLDANMEGRGGKNSRPPSLFSAKQF